MNVFAKFAVFEVRRVILELNIDPKSFEEEQNIIFKHNKREEGGPICARERPESRFIGLVDVLERLQARQDLQGISEQLAEETPRASKGRPRDPQEDPKGAQETSKTLPRPS